MITKIHADLINGVIEVEGSEEFVTNSFKEFRESFGQIRLKLPINSEIESDAEESENSAALEKSKPKPKTKPKTKSSSSGNKLNLTIVTDFHDGNEGKEFLEEIKKYKIPDSGQKLVVLYIYLMKKVGVTGITANHVYTAYRLQGKKPPNNLSATLNNARVRLGYLKQSGPDGFQTNHKGEDFVLLELLDKTQ